MSCGEIETTSGLSRRDAPVNSNVCSGCMRGGRWQKMVSICWALSSPTLSSCSGGSQHHCILQSFKGHKKHPNIYDIPRPMESEQLAMGPW